MLSIFHISLICIFVAILPLIILSFFLAYKLSQSRIKLNQILEEKAKIIEEADYYAQLAKNPLGPIFSQNTTPLILSFDTKGTITNANDNLLQKFGYSKKHLIGKNILGTILQKPKKETDSMIYRLFKNPSLFLDAETETFTKTGQRIWVSWTNKVIYNKNGKPVGADAVGFDVTKRKDMEAELQYLSSIDPQTGVMNRHALLETGTTELKRAKRYRRSLSVVVFKIKSKISDISLSDEQLRAITSLAREVIRSVDYIGRISDVEFALILPETDRANVPFLMNRLMEYIDKYNTQTKNQIGITYVAASFSKQSDTIDNLLTQAWRKIDAKKEK